MGEQLIREYVRPGTPQDLFELEDRVNGEDTETQSAVDGQRHQNAAEE
jgi:hypothetical protein